MRCFGRLFTVVVVVALSVVWSNAEGGTRDSAWEALLRADPSAADDASIGWRERLVMHALTPAQAEAYFRRGADPDTLVVEDGRTLREYLEARLSPPAGVFVALPAPCRLFAADRLEAGARYGVRARGGDLSAQGGSATGCGVPAEATAVVLQVGLDGPSAGGRLKLWAADGPEPAEGAMAAGGFGAESRRATVVAALAARSGSDGDLLLRSAAAASVDAELIGYFRPPTALDNPTPVVSFYTEGSSNNFFGTGAGASTSGDHNSFFGAHAGWLNSTGSRNSFFGSSAGLNNTANDNSFFGERAGWANTTGDSNAFFGERAGYANAGGGSNSFFGRVAGYSNTGGSNNSFFGRGAGYYNTSGGHNAYFGAYAGNSSGAANYNTFVGTYAGYNNTASENSFFGRRAGYGNTSGVHNSHFGHDAGYSVSTTSDNSFFGYKAGHGATGRQNAAFGSEAGPAAGGDYNAFFGRGAGEKNTGNDNSFFGWRAGNNNTTGFSNSFFGEWAGQNNTTGSNNAFFGDVAGASNTTESNNSFIGTRSTGFAGITNATALGYRAQVRQSNSLVLGSIAGLNGAAANVNVGIGVPAPQRQLHLKGNNAVFRMDRDSDTAAFMIVRTNAAGSPLKTFVVGTNAAGADNGEFVVNDLGAAVGGPGTRRMTITNAGETHFTGIVRAPSFVSTSSLRFKENVHPIRNAPDLVDRLHGVSFNWKDTGRPSVGLIAEEVAEVIPEVVDWEENGLEAAGVNYSALVAVLIEAVKAQRRRAEAQAAEISGQRADLAVLRARVGELESERAELVSLRSRLAEIERRLAGGLSHSVAAQR
jgi:hypothetical protein